MGFSQEIYGASMLAAFKGGDAVDPGKLVYSNLASVAIEAHSKEYPLMRCFLEAEPGSLDEEQMARFAARGYFIRTAQQLHNTAPARQPELSRRFTQQSVELYGAPVPEVAARLMHTQREEFLVHSTNANVSEAHVATVLSTLARPEGSVHVVELDEGAANTAAEQINRILQHRYGNVLRLFDTDRIGVAHLDLETIADLFTAGVAELARSDPAWAEWRVAITSGEGMATLVEEQQFAIGKRGNYLPERLKPLFAHEVLTHGLRGLQSKKTGNKLLVEGLPGNLEAEEGMGIFSEYAVSGTIADKVTDRYIDVALALGSTGLTPLTRQELHTFHASRKIVRAQAATNKNVDEMAVKAAAWNHVDRIYRGSLGNDIIGVNTKDISYYQGFHKISEFISRQLAEGRSSEEIFDWIMQGRFDPTDARHIAYIQNYRSSIEI